MAKLIQSHRNNFFEEWMYYSTLVPGTWYLSDARIFVQLAQNKTRSQQPFVDKINNKKLDVIILNEGPVEGRVFDPYYGNSGLTKEMRESIQNNYYPGYARDNNFLYYPNKTN